MTQTEGEEEEEREKTTSHHPIVLFVYYFENYICHRSEQRSKICFCFFFFSLMAPYGEVKG
jgi:Zn-finger protein